MITDGIDYQTKKQSWERRPEATRFKLRRASSAKIFSGRWALEASRTQSELPVEQPRPPSYFAAAPKRLRAWPLGPGGFSSHARASSTPTLEIRSDGIISGSDTPSDQRRTFFFMGRPGGGIRVESMTGLLSMPSPRRHVLEEQCHGHLGARGGGRKRS